MKKIPSVMKWRKKPANPKENETQDSIEPLEDQLKWFRQQLPDRSDVVYHTFSVGQHVFCALIYLQNMIDIQSIQEEVLHPLLSSVAMDEAEIRKHLFEKKLLPIADYHFIAKKDGVPSILNSHVLLLVEGEKRMIALPLALHKKRDIDEPPNEATVRGPRESFIESAVDNFTLIRKRLKTPDLKSETLQIGKHTNTSVIMMYVQGICKNELVDEVRNRLAQIKVDSLLGSSYLEEAMDYSPFSPFPQVQFTERPDVVVASLLEGRVGIIVDGTPTVVLAPVTLFMLLQSAEDYYQRFFASTWIRWLRYLFVIISLLLPSSYIAITTFHPEMIPSKLLVTITASREVVPFPALIEALIMEVSFEALREAAIRIPKSIGQAVSIIGALIIGTAAVQAGIVSASMVIIVSFTGIASFIIPQYDLGLAFRFLRFPIMILAGLFGLFGMTCGLLIIYIHLTNLRPFGYSYLTPLTPFVFSDLKDTIVRAPWWMMRTRPFSLGVNRIRQSRHSRKARNTLEEDED